MEEKSVRWSLLTAVAPLTWGTTYYVTKHALPADFPLWGSVLRALPAGLVLLLVVRRLPRGAWWWRSLVLGTLSMGAFFALVYVAAQLLPSSVASTVMATSPVVMMLVAWALLAQRPRVLALAGAGLGVAGVAAMLLTGGGDVRVVGVVASVAAMLMSSVGFVLATRWADGVDVVSSTAWQLVAGGLVLVPFAVAVEGAPPALDARAVLGFAYVSLVATAVAYLAWFTGLRRLPAGTVGLVGLLNPVAGVLLGVLLAGETLTPLQVAGVAVVLLGVVLGQPVVERALRARRDRRTETCTVDVPADAHAARRPVTASARPPVATAPTGPTRPGAARRPHVASQSRR
ncbi:EamA family transporter [Cellulomonas biazotea]|uniref:EamA family transporter n=1 Tax=Cellulomonas biazotea TaxID=1709 RepID=UPI001C3FF322|nr:EamA family transporter [Cellulomonas biazotea]